MKIQILGSGCKKCNQLRENAEAAARELGLDFEIEKITDFGEIARLGALVTPALAIDGRLKLAGRVATPEELKPILAQG
ncbi:MAG: thioredoxin family protein [Bryobacteraceae bacterium]|nr:thioredoxin family protein [Bryobacteraceae bacterium]MCX7604164.1 thioredoxin family protein [Bryobacteraceae bacterium]